jgi:UDP-2-acetamido-3-amino-2,3-dideoxy-glucuronate N-acetyltransferase
MEFIAKTAKIGSDTTIGENTIIKKNVKIGDNCTIGHHVVIHEGTTISDNVRIDDHTVIGKQPMRAKRSIFKEETLPPAQISNNCLIGAHAVLYAGCTVAQHVLIADTAAIRENVTIGEYTIVGRGVTIENLCKIGKKCKLETGCYITAYSEIEDYCFIAPQVTTTNDNFLGRTEERFEHFKGVTVRRGGRIGAGAVILPGIEIGVDAVVGAGAVFTQNVPSGQIYVGAPAKYFRDTPVEQLLENHGWD